MASRTMLLFAFAIVGAVRVSFASGIPQQKTRPASVGSLFTVADFDGDSKPDVARVQTRATIAGASRYSIDFELSTGLEQRVMVNAPSGGLSLVSRDVNGDNFPDVVVTTAWTGSPVAVLINDGRGNFTRIDPANFPEAFGTTEHSVNSPWSSHADGFALVFPRPLPGECAADKSLGATQNVFSRIAQRRPCFASLDGRNAFLGRAPPFFLL